VVILGKNQKFHFSHKGERWYGAKYGFYCFGFHALPDRPGAVEEDPED
jgi:hypothetical protein